MTLMISDLHFGFKKNDEQFLNGQLDFFKKSLFDLILSKKITQVVCLGDFFDNRTNINSNTLYKLKNEFFHFFKQFNIKLILLLGNHDIYYKNTTKINSLEIFETPQKLFE